MGICALYVFLYVVKTFESPKALYKFPINPFTAILAAPSLGNRPVKSAKCETIKAPHPPPPPHEYVKGILSKCTVSKVDLLQDH